MFSFTRVYTYRVRGLPTTVAGPRSRLNALLAESCNA